DHFGATPAEAEPMHGAGGKMHERAGRSRRRFGADAEVDLALDDVEGLVPGMAMRWRAAAFGPTLEEDLIAFRRFARCEHGDVFADDVERRRVILGRDHERFHGHFGLPFSSIVSRVAWRPTTRWFSGGASRRPRRKRGSGRTTQPPPFS